MSKLTQLWLTCYANCSGVSSAGQRWAAFKEPITGTEHPTRKGSSKVWVWTSADFWRVFLESIAPNRSKTMVQLLYPFGGCYRWHIYTVQYTCTWSPSRGMTSLQGIYERELSAHIELFSLNKNVFETIVPHICPHWYAILGQVFHKKSPDISRHLRHV